MTTALYKLADDFVVAAQQMADLDLPDNVISDTLEGLSGEIEVKATNVAMFVRNLESSAEAIKSAEYEMALRRKSIENRAKHIRAYLQDQLIRTGITKIDSPYFKLSIRENPPAVVIDIEGLIPSEFMRQPETPPPVPDKKAISEALKAGTDIPGVHLERGKRLEIK